MVRITAVERASVSIRGVDLCHGTPVLDVKPWQQHLDIFGYRLGWDVVQAACAAGTSSDVATLLSVSDDTVRRWVDAGRRPVADSPTTQRAVDGTDVARLAKDRGRPTSDPSTVGRSARNRFVGLVTEVLCDTVLARVTLQCGDDRIEAVMSTEAVRELDLQPGSLAVAVVKATEVLVETPGPTGTPSSGADSRDVQLDHVGDVSATLDIPRHDQTRSLQLLTVLGPREQDVLVAEVG